MPQNDFPAGTVETPLQQGTKAASDFPKGTVETPLSAAPTAPVPDAPTPPGVLSKAWNKVKEVYPEAARFTREQSPMGQLLLGPNSVLGNILDVVKPQKPLFKEPEKYSPEVAKALAESGGMLPEAVTSRYNALARRPVLDVGEYMKKADPFTRGVGQGLSGLTTLENVGIIAVAPESKVVTGAFGLMMGHGTYGLDKAAREAHAAGDKKKALELRGQELVSGVATAGAALGLMSREHPSGGLATPKAPDVPKSFAPDPLAAPKVGLSARADAALSKVGLTLEPAHIREAKQAIEDLKVMEAQTRAPFKSAADLPETYVAAEGGEAIPQVPVEPALTLEAELAQLRAQLAEMGPELGPKPTALKPGEELPRPLGKTVRSKLPPRTPVAEATEAGGARPEPAPGQTPSKDPVWQDTSYITKSFWAKWNKTKDGGVAGTLREALAGKRWEDYHAQLPADYGDIPVVKKMFKATMVAGHDKVGNPIPQAATIFKQPNGKFGIVINARLEMNADQINQLLVEEYTHILRSTKGRSVTPTAAEVELMKAPGGREQIVAERSAAKAVEHVTGFYGDAVGVTDEAYHELVTKGKLPSSPEARVKGIPETPVKTVPVAKPKAAPEKLFSDFERTRAQIRKFEGTPAAAQMVANLKNQAKEQFRQYAAAVGPEGWEAAANQLRSSFPDLEHDINYLDQSIKTYPQWTEMQAKLREISAQGTEQGSPHALRDSEGRLILGEGEIDEATGIMKAGGTQPEEGAPHSFREVKNALLGNRVVEVGDTQAKVLSDKLSEEEKQFVQNAKDELEEAKYTLRNDIGSIGVEKLDDFKDRMKELEKLINKYERPATRKVAGTTKAKVAVAKGVPVESVTTTGTGGPINNKHGGLPVMNQAIQENSYGAAKGQKVWGVPEMTEKLAELRKLREDRGLAADALEKIQRRREEERGGVGNKPVSYGDLVAQKAGIVLDSNGLIENLKGTLGFGEKGAYELLAHMERHGSGGDYSEIRDLLEAKGLLNKDNGYGMLLINDWVSRAQDLHERDLIYDAARNALHDRGVSGTKLLAGMTSGGVAGAAVGTSVGGPVGGAIGGALGAVTGAVAAGVDLHAAFPTFMDRLSQFARAGSAEEELTPGLRTKSTLREAMGEKARTTAQLREQTKELETRISKEWTAQQGIQYMIDVAKGTRPLNKGEQQLKDLSDQIFGDRISTIENLQHGSYDQWREHYFPGLYERPAAVKDWVQRQLGAKSPIAGAGSFRRQKVFNDMGEAMAAGFKPISTNPLTLVRLKAAEMDKYIVGHQTLVDLKEQGIAKFYRAYKNAPKGWMPISDSIGEAWARGPKGERLLHGKYYLPPDAAQVFNNYVSPGFKGLGPGWAKGYDVARRVANAENQFQLGMSAFHITTTAINSVMSDAARGLNLVAHGHPIDAAAPLLRAGTLTSPFKAWYDGRQMLDEYLSPGTNARYADTVDALARAGGRAQMDAQYLNQHAQRMQELWRQGRPIRATMHVPFAAMELVASPIMQHLVPAVKLGTFHAIAGDILARSNKNGWSEDVTTRELDRAWNSVDGRMGQAVQDNVFINNLTKQVANIMVRSAGWTFGTMAELGGGVTDFARQSAKVLTGDKPELTQRMAYTIALPAMAAYVGALLNYVYTGHGPTRPRDLFYIPTGQKGADGRDEYVTIPSYMKDVLSYTYSPVGTAINKMHPLIHSVIQMVENKDFYGVEIAHQDDPMLTQLKDYSEFALKQFIPISFTNAEQRVKAGWGEFTQSAFGLTGAPKYGTMTPAERDLYEDLGRRIGGVRTQAAFERAQLKNSIEEAMRTNDNPERQRLIQQARQQGTLSDADLDDIHVASRVPYFQSAVKRATLEDLVKLYATNKPNQGERKTLHAEIMLKFETSLDDMPKQPRDEILALYRKGRAKDALEVK